MAKERIGTTSGSIPIPKNNEINLTRDYLSLPPKRTYKIKVRFKKIGKGKPLPCRAFDDKNQ